MKPWLIIDTSILLDAVRYTSVPGDDPAFPIIRAYRADCFVWVYSDDILAEYQYQYRQKKRQVVHSDDKRHFDDKTFSGVMAALPLGPKVEPTEEQLNRAYDVMMDPRRPEHLRDEDDIIYLAAAEAARASDANVEILVGSNDSDLYRLRTYLEFPVITGSEMIERLSL